MSENPAPEGRPSLAQRFSAGLSGRNDSSPGGTAEIASPIGCSAIAKVIPLKLSLQAPHHFRNQFFVAPVPVPVALSLRFHHAGPFQDAHVMRNRRLRQLHTLLDIAGTEAGFLVERASALFFERTQNPAADRK